MSNSQPVPGAQSIMRAVDILEQFSESTPSLMVKDIARATGLTSSTVHRVVKALESREMLMQDPVTKEYRLGPAIARLASPMLHQGGISGLVAPALRSLQQFTGEAVAFQVRIGFSRVCVLEYESQHHLQYRSGVGQTFPLVAGSAGKAFLAYLPEAEARDIIDEAWGSDRWILRPREQDDLLAELRSIRRRGYATSTGEVRADGAGIASAILDLNGSPLGVINVGSPAVRCTDEMLDRVGRAVYAAALGVEKSMGLPARSERGLDGSGREVGVPRRASK